MKKIYLFVFILLANFSLSAQDLRIFALGDKYGIIDAATNKIIVEAKYDKIESFYNNLLELKLNKKFGIINYQGIEIAAVIYDYIALLKEDMALAERNGFYGYIDTLGREIITCKYNLRPGSCLHEPFASITIK
jgi:hypothetical protein